MELAQWIVPHPDLKNEKIVECVDFEELLTQEFLLNMRESKTNREQIV
jgi:hypothetical protein